MVQYGGISRQYSTMSPPICLGGPWSAARVAVIPSGTSGVQDRRVRQNLNFDRYRSWAVRNPLCGVSAAKLSLCAAQQQWMVFEVSVELILPVFSALITYLFSTDK